MYILEVIHIHWIKTLLPTAKKQVKNLPSQLMPFSSAEHHKH